MHYDLLRPCSNCPFLRKGGIRLTEERVESIAGMMLSPEGGTFACHKTTAENSDGTEMRETKDSRHCAGALIFSEANGNATQMMRIAERLGMYNPKKMMSDQEAVDSVFADVEEMLDVHRSEEICAARRNARKRCAKGVPRLRRKAKV